MEHYKKLICPFMSGPVFYPHDEPVYEGPATNHAHCVGPKCVAFFSFEAMGQGTCSLIPECQPMDTADDADNPF